MKVKKISIMAASVFACLLLGFFCRAASAADRLLCRLTRGSGSEGGVWEDMEFEYMKTDFGYVARFYSIPNDVVHKLAISGDDGAVGLGETKFDTFYASMDFPKECRSSYELMGTRFVFQRWDGERREYKINR